LIRIYQLPELPPPPKLPPPPEKPPLELEDDHLSQSYCFFQNHPPLGIKLDPYFFAKFFPEEVKPTNILSKKIVIA
jgi:hypothetical protein